jgi:transcriptional regulator with XRE-family HTH domain
LARSPAASRRRLGVELRVLREGAGKRIDDAAAALECSTAKISRLENGKGVPYARDVRDLAALYGDVAKARLDELLELAEDGRAQEWYSAFKDVLQGDLMADHLLRYMTLERDAVEMKLFEPDLIPGLLQSEGYIDAVCSIVAPHYSERERARFVQFRRMRQDEVLSGKEHPELSVIVSQLAIVRMVGGPDVMRDQLLTLRADLSGRLKDIDFRIVPFHAEARGALGGSFAILKYGQIDDQNLVYLEGREGATWLESDGEVSRYEGYFSGLERECLPRDESLDELTRAAERLTQEVEDLA